MKLEALIKALEAGVYHAAPSTLVQGSALVGAPTAECTCGAKKSSGVKPFEAGHSTWCDAHESKKPEDWYYL